MAQNKNINNENEDQLIQNEVNPQVQSSAEAAEEVEVKANIDERIEDTRDDVEENAHIRLNRNGNRKRVKTQRGLPRFSNNVSYGNNGGTTGPDQKYDDFQLKYHSRIIGSDTPELQGQYFQSAVEYFIGSGRSRELANMIGKSNISEEKRIFAVSAIINSGNIDNLVRALNSWEKVDSSTAYRMIDRGYGNVIADVLDKVEPTDEVDDIAVLLIKNGFIPQVEAKIRKNLDLRLVPKAIALIVEDILERESQGLEKEQKFLPAVVQGEKEKGMEVDSFELLMKYLQEQSKNPNKLKRVLTRIQKHPQYLALVTDKWDLITGGNLDINKFLPVKAKPVIARPVDFQEEPGVLENNVKRLEEFSNRKVIEFLGKNDFEMAFTILTRLTEISAETAKLLIDKHGGWGRDAKFLMENINKIAPRSHLEIAELLIEKGGSWAVLDNLEKFSKRDRRKIIEKLTMLDDLREVDVSDENLKNLVGKTLPVQEKPKDKNLLGRLFDKISKRVKIKNVKNKSNNMPPSTPNSSINKKQDAIDYINVAINSNDYDGAIKALEKSNNLEKIKLSDLNLSAVQSHDLIKRWVENLRTKPVDAASSDLEAVRIIASELDEGIKTINDLFKFNSSVHEVVEKHIAASDFKNAYKELMKDKSLIPRFSKSIGDLLNARREELMNPSTTPKTFTEAVKELVTETGLSEDDIKKKLKESVDYGLKKGDLGSNIKNYNNGTGNIKGVVDLFKKYGFELTKTSTDIEEKDLAKMVGKLVDEKINSTPPVDKDAAITAAANEFGDTVTEESVKKLYKLSKAPTVIDEKNFNSEISKVLESEFSLKPAVDFVMMGGENEIRLKVKSFTPALRTKISELTKYNAAFDEKGVKGYVVLRYKEVPLDQRVENYAKALERKKGFKSPEAKKEARVAFLGSLEAEARKDAKDKNLDLKDKSVRNQFMTDQISKFFESSKEITKKRVELKKEGFGPKIVEKLRETLGKWSRIKWGWRMAAGLSLPVLAGLVGGPLGAGVAAYGVKGLFSAPLLHDAAKRAGYKIKGDKFASYHQQAVRQSGRQQLMADNQLFKGLDTPAKEGVFTDMQMEIISSVEGKIADSMSKTNPSERFDGMTPEEQAEFIAKELNKEFEKKLEELEKQQSKLWLRRLAEYGSAAVVGWGLSAAAGAIGESIFGSSTPEGGASPDAVKTGVPANSGTVPPVDAYDPGVKLEGKGINLLDPEDKLKLDPSLTVSPDGGTVPPVDAYNPGVNLEGKGVNLLGPENQLKLDPSLVALDVQADVNDVLNNTPSSKFLNILDSGQKLTFEVPGDDMPVKLANGGFDKDPGLYRIFDRLFPEMDASDKISVRSDLLGLTENQEPLKRFLNHEKITFNKDIVESIASKSNLSADEVAKRLFDKEYSWKMLNGQINNR